MKRATYTAEPREAYALQLRLIRAKLNKLDEMLEETAGDGICADTIEWADVGLARRTNLILEEAVQTGM